ncbi:hypothetical protein E2C01_005815 [Portunus trituberculatus]|uniref:Uncharacterized protein n=1 Tax=Portunus trituberculatus TaxID=210409 RepID=A0A5B7CXL3_PORTR|nr:hypothetical protein [Portunus trituberculatus]
MSSFGYYSLVFAYLFSGPCCVSSHHNSIIFLLVSLYIQFYVLSSVGFWVIGPFSWGDL